MRRQRLLLQLFYLLGAGLLFACDAAAAIALTASYGRSDNSTTAQVRPTSSAGAAAGNLYVAQIVVAGGDCAAISTPTGWTRRACDSSAGHIQAVYTRPALASDRNVTFSFALGSALRWGSILLSYSGADLTNPLDAGPSVSTYSATKSATATPITTATAGAMAVLLTSANTSGNNFFAAPSGWTERRERACSNSVCRLDAADRLYSAAGSSITATTTTKKNASGIVHLLALRPYSLVAHWPLDGVTWTTDLSGSGNTLTAQGGALPANAKVCTGLNGNGSTYLTAADAAALDLPDRYTISAWVYPTAYPASDLMSIVTKDENYELHLTPTGRLNWWWTESGGTERSIDSTGSVPLNAWTHVAVVFDRLAGSSRQRIFINGVQEATTYSYGTAALTNAKALYIGSDVGYTSGSPNRNFAGLIDEVRIYNGALSQSQIAADMAATHSCAVDHYRLNLADGAGLTCTPEPVTLAACSNADCSQVYLGAASVQLGATGGATLNPATVPLAAGAGSSEVALGSAGTTTLSLTSGSPTPAGAVPYRCFVAGNEVAWTACQINFQAARLLLDLPDITACTGSSEATITAEGCGSTVTGSKSLKIWMAYANPSSANGEALKAGSLTVPTSEPAANNLTLTFDADGVAPLPLLNYDDAGQLTLYAKLTTGGATLSGGESFVSAPEKLALSSATGACAGPGYAACSAFAKAGGAFNLTLAALCSSGKVTRNFRQSAIPLTSTRLAPDPGTDGVLSPTEVSLAAGDNGQKIFAAAMTEVGVFAFAPSTVSYLGVDVPGQGSGPLGRFYPDHFDTTVADACGSFTYAGQPFPLTVTARNASGGTTLNYAGSFAKAGTLADVNGAAGSFSPATVLATKYLAGVADLTTTPEVSFTFAAKKTAPATLKVRVNDGEASSAAGSEGTSPLRAGRLVLSNAYGSDLLKLSLPVETQYWKGSYWATNAADSCTMLTGGIVTSSTPCVTPSVVEIAAGKGSLNFAAPGAKCSVDVCAHLSGDADNPLSACQGAVSGRPSWLQGSWDADGNYNDNPAARATFGIYGPRSPVIYLRERY